MTRYLHIDYEKDGLMNKYLIAIMASTLISCSSQVPNAAYYQNLASYDDNPSRKPLFARPYAPNTISELRETLYREREWHRRQMAQKDATIEGLRKELFQTRAYVTDLMNELSKINTAQRKDISLYEQEDAYQNVVYTVQARDRAISFVSATQEVREPIGNTILTLEEDTKEATNTQGLSGETHAVHPEEPMEMTPLKEQTVKELPRQKQSKAPVDKAREIYDGAMKLLNAKEYEKARARFDAMIASYPKHILIPNAWYWKAETFYSMGEYARAISAFMTIVNQYPKSQKAPDALLKIVMSYSALKDTSNAKKYKEVLLTSYPTSTSAKKARQMVL